MSFSVYVRSVKAKNRPASIRPDNVDIYVQLDIYYDHLTLDNGAWTSQVAPCTSNINFLKSYTLNSGLYVCNPFTSIKDVVVCKQQNEDDDDYQSLEDGRSRRYFLKVNKYAHMFSVPILDSHCPITFNVFNVSNENTGNFRVCVLRICTYGKDVLELAICLLGGKNLFSYKEVSIDDYKQDLHKFLSLCDRTQEELNQWKKNGSRRREFIILLMKNHCAPIDVFDPKKFNMRYGKKWNLTNPYVRYNENETVANWFDILGWRSSTSDISAFLTKYDFDDHTPCLFEIITPFNKSAKAFEKQELRDQYYIEKPWKDTLTYRKHDGTVIAEIDRDTQSYGDLGFNA